MTSTIYRFRFIAVLFYALRIHSTVNAMRRANLSWFVLCCSSLAVGEKSVAFLELEQMLRSVGSAEALTALLRDAELTRQFRFVRRVQRVDEHLTHLQMHGMGDYATNPHGMVPLQESISDYLNGTYVLNVQIGDNAVEDVLNSFLMNLDDQVDYFAEVVSSDPQLSEGFNAVGYSQGNLVVRGYIERYNSPQCYNFISMHGPMMGVAGFPDCNLSHDLCVAFDTLLAELAYTTVVQNNLAQANYYRFPMNLDQYLETDVFLADVNNERDTLNEQYQERFGALHTLCAVKASKDTVVIPKESEWFGFYADNSLEEIIPMNQTAWYLEDWYGLKSLDKGGALQFFSTSGNHLDFETDELLALIDDCFTV